MFVPLLVDLIFSALSIWTNQVMTGWLVEMAESIDKEKPLQVLLAFTRVREHACLNDSEIEDNGSIPSSGYRTYPTILTKPGVYYHLYSETDPICYSLSDLEDMEEDILFELRDISMSGEELEDSVFVSEEDNVI